MSPNGLSLEMSAGPDIVDRYSGMPIDPDTGKHIDVESQLLLHHHPRKYSRSSTADDQTALMSIQLEGGKSLKIDYKTLKFHDPVLKKEAKHAIRSSCLPGNTASHERSIPIYNILWAEISNHVITIDYVQTSKGVPKLERLSYELSNKGDPGGDQLERESESAHAKAKLKPQQPTDDAAFVSSLMIRAYSKSKKEKRALVLINPNAGPGCALKRWRTEVLPLFNAARMDLEVKELTRGGEATDMVRKMDIDRFDTVIACSGDGGPHEVFNGLAKREDAKKALNKIAVSHIPCGSGNAMALNLYGSNDAGVAALGVIKGVVTPLDLVSITHGSTRTISFLSQAVGIIAESDLATEHLRWMGSTRFEVGLFARILRSKCYPCDIAVKVEIEDKNDVKGYYKRYVNDRLDTPDQPHDIQEDQGLPDLRYGTVQDPLPKGWELVPHDKIGNFYCGNMAYMSPDANFFPAALPSDGRMDLVTMNGDLSFYKAINTLLAVKDGNFYDMPHVTYRKISAYRIVPRDQNDGYISIDGERIPFGPFQAEIHPGLGNVLSKRGVFEAEGPKDWELS